MSNSEAQQVLQRLHGLKIAETPKDHHHQKQKDPNQRECYSLDSKMLQLVPATPSTGGEGTFLTQLKKRRKHKINRIYNYEMDQHFIKARKSLNF